MPRSPLADINPVVFRWLRGSSGWTISDVAKRLNTSDAVILAIEAGERKPTLRQLKELTTAFRRPLAAFFLPQPKVEKPLPKDYRMVHPDLKGVFSKKTILALRKARHLQSISQELSSNTGSLITPTIESVDIKINPLTISNTYRKKFELTFEKQKDFSSSYKFFNYLRDILEDWNILVFQFSMPVDDARGFIFADDFPVVIVVNTKDTIEARIFTLMHEFAHFLLGETVIDIPSLTKTPSTKIEKWCNTFASSFLFPKEDVKDIFEIYHDTITETNILNRVSRKLKLSKSMILYNLYKYDFISQNVYNSVLERYQKITSQITPSEGGGIPIDRKRLSELGVKFVSLVIDNFEKQHITYSDALGYLSIKSKNFNKVLAKAGK